jgi:hypothetical protein
MSVQSHHKPAVKSAPKSNDLLPVVTGAGVNQQSMKDRQLQLKINKQLIEYKRKGLMSINEGEDSYISINFDKIRLPIFLTNLVLFKRMQTFLPSNNNQIKKMLGLKMSPPTPPPQYISPVKAPTF